MKKKLPGVFPGKVKKNSGNNNKIFYSEKKEIEKPVNDNLNKPKININQKINKILNSPSYVYKADVIITLKNDTVEKRIVGRNNTHLITIENELIPLNDIKDIKTK